MRRVLLALVAVSAAVAAVALGSELSAPEQVAQPGVRMRTVVARDSSGNGHHAVVQGPVQMERPGRYGSSFSFHQPDSWLMVPPAADLNPADRDFLVTLWVLLGTGPDRGETYDVLRKGISYTIPGEFKLEVLHPDRVRCTAKDDQELTARVTTDKVRVIDGRWHQFGCARTGPLWSVLVDDTVTSRRTALGTVRNEVALSIGSKYGMEDRPTGRIDDVRIVMGRRYYQGGPEVDGVTRLEALKGESPTAWWRLDEAPTTRLPGSGRAR